MPTLPFRGRRTPGEHGHVDAYTVSDLNVGYRIPGLTGVSAQLDIKNLFDNERRTFVGTPLLGRLVMVCPRYEFRLVPHATFARRRRSPVGPRRGP